MITDNSTVKYSVSVTIALDETGVKDVIVGVTKVSDTSAL